MRRSLQSTALLIGGRTYQIRAKCRLQGDPVNIFRHFPKGHFSKIFLVVTKLGIGFIFLSGLLVSCVVPMLANTTHPVYELEWHPNGDSFALSGNGLRLYSADLSELVVLSSTSDFRGSGVTWNADGSRIADLDCSVRVWNVETKQKLVEIGDRPCASAIAWSPDGKLLAVGMVDGIIRVLNADNYNLRANLNGHTEQINTITWSPDSSKLVSGSADTTVRIWDLENQLNSQTLQVEMRVYAISWDSAGKWLAIGGSSNSVQLWDTTSMQLLSSLVPASEWISVTSIDWSPDNTQLIIAAQNTLQKWDSLSGQVLLTFAGHDGTIDAVRWSPDGERLVSVGADNIIRMWNSTTGQTLLDRSLD